MEKFKKILQYFLLFAFLIVFVYSSFYNGFLFYLLSMVFILIVSFKFKCKNFSIFLFVFSLLLRLVAIILIKTPLDFDYAKMYNASRELLNGTKDYYNSTYFINWGYQMGHVIYQYLLLRICDSTFFLKIMNCIIHSGTIVLLYKLSKHFTNEICARIISLIYSLFLFPLLLNTVLSNQQLSAFAMILAIYVLIMPKFDNMNKLLRNVIVGLLLVISNISRPEVIVIIFSLFVYYILNITKDNWKNICKSFAIIVVTYLLVFNVVSKLLIVNNISQSGLENKNPAWKFVVGLNPYTVGKYSPEDASKYSSYENIEDAKKIIYDRSIGSITKLPKLFIKKSVIFWTESNLYWSTYYLSGTYVTILGKEVPYETINNIAINYNKYFLLTITMLFLIGLVYNIRYCKHNSILLFYIIILTYYGVYLLIEIWPGYAYSPQMFLTVAGSFGVKAILDKNELYKKAMKKIGKKR